MSVLEHLPTGDVWRSGQVAVPKNLPVYGTMDKCLYLNTYLLEMYAGVDKWLYLKTYLCMEQWTVSVLEHLPAGNIWRSGQVAVPDNLSVYGLSLIHI